MKVFWIAMVMALIVGCGGDDVPPGPNPGPGPSPEPEPKADTFEVVGKKMCETPKGEKPCIQIKAKMKAGEKDKLPNLKARVETVIQMLEKE